MNYIIGNVKVCRVRIIVMSLIDVWYIIYNKIFLDNKIKNMYLFYFLKSYKNEEHK